MDIAQIGRSAAPYVDDVALLGARTMGMNTGNKAQEVEDRAAEHQKQAEAQMMQSASPMALNNASNPPHASLPKSIATAPADLAHSIHDKAAELASRAHHETYKQLHKKDVGEEGAMFKAAAPVENAASTANNVATVAMLGTDMVVPLVAGGLGFVGLDRASKFVHKPHDFMYKPVPEGKLTRGEKLNNFVMGGMTALQAYGVAKGYSQNLNALKHMYADVTGIPAENVSTMTILTGKVPEVVREARNHFLKEYISRGAVSALGIGLVGRSIMRGKMVGMMEALVPMGAGMAVDALMGDSILPYYTGFANAYNSGQKLPPATYSEFIMSASEELKKRGKMGHRMAILLGEEYSKDQTNPAEILKELESNRLAHKHGMKGKFDERIDHILDRIEHQKTMQPQGMSMVDRLQGKSSHDVEVKGKYTQRYQQELMNRGQQSPNRVTPT